MRGTLDILIIGVNRIGIIPAYAGNTRHVFFPFLIGWDHPRVCGEHAVHGGDLATPQGSSPRMRGTLSRRGRKGFQGGIIPAYAGNTE